MVLSFTSVDTDTVSFFQFQAIEGQEVATGIVRKVSFGIVLHLEEDILIEVTILTSYQHKVFTFVITGIVYLEDVQIVIYQVVQM